MACHFVAMRRLVSACRMRQVAQTLRLFPALSAFPPQTKKEAASISAKFRCLSACGIGGLRTARLIDRQPAPLDELARKGHESPRASKLANSGPSECHDPPIQMSRPLPYRKGDSFDSQPRPIKLILPRHQLGGRPSRPTLPLCTFAIDLYDSE